MKSWGLSIGRGGHHSETSRRSTPCHFFIRGVVVIGLDEIAGFRVSCVQNVKRPFTRRTVYALPHPTTAIAVKSDLELLPLQLG